MVHDDCMCVRARVSHEEEEEEEEVVVGGGGRCSTTPYRFPLPSSVVQCSFLILFGLVLTLRFVLFVFVVHCTDPMRSI